MSEDPILAPYTPLSVGEDRVINDTIWLLPGRVETPGLNTPHLLNAYAYAENNPTRFRDPSGLFFEDKSCRKEIDACHRSLTDEIQKACVGTNFNTIGDKCARTKCPEVDRNCALKDLQNKTDFCFGKDKLPPPPCRAVKACVEKNF